MTYNLLGNQCLNDFSYVQLEFTLKLLIRQGKIKFSKNKHLQGNSVQAQNQP